MFGIYFSEETGSTNIFKPYYESTVICCSGLSFDRYKLKSSFTLHEKFYHGELFPEIHNLELNDHSIQ